MFRKFMSPAEILQRSADSQGGSGGQGSPVTLKQIADAIENTKKEAEAAMTALKKQLEDAQKDAAKASEVASLTAKLAIQEKALEDVNAYIEQVQLMQGQKADVRKKSLQDEIGVLVRKNHSEILAGKGKKTPMELKGDEDTVYQIKADMSFSRNVSGAGPIVPPDYSPGILGQPLEVPHLRTLINVGSTSGQVYFFAKGKLREGSPKPGIIPIAGEKTQIEFDFVVTSVKVIKIAGYVTVPEEMIDDVDGMTSFLQTYLPEEVMNKEDDQIFNGTGDANSQFEGLFTTSPTYTPSAGVDANEPWDIIADAIAQLMTARFYPTRTLVSPTDWMFLATRKSTDGVYSHPTLIYGTPLMIAGVPVLPHPNVPVDKFLVGRFTSVELKVRRGLTVRFYDQHATNAIFNLITIVAEMREAFANYYPEAFLVGDFGRVA